MTLKVSKKITSVGSSLNFDGQINIFGQEYKMMWSSKKECNSILLINSKSVALEKLIIRIIHF